MDNQKLTWYLKALETTLESATPERRAEIILEVKKQINELMSHGSSVESAIQQMGEVRNVALKYGIRYNPRPSRLAQFVKWIFIIFVFMSLLVGVGIWWVSKSIVESANTFEFQMGDDKVTLGGQTFPFSEQETLLEESKDVQANGIKRLELKFSNGKVRYAVSDSSLLSWRCKVRGIDGTHSTSQNGDILTVNLIESIGSKCDVKIPKGLELISKGGNGDVQLIKPEFSVDLKLGNGKVEIEPLDKQDYVYDVEVTNGRVSEMNSSQNPNALRIKIRMTNGLVTLDD